MGAGFRIWMRGGAVRSCGRGRTDQPSPGSSTGCSGARSSRGAASVAPDGAPGPLSCCVRVDRGMQTGNPQEMLESTRHLNRSARSGARAAGRVPGLPRSAGVQLHPTALPGGRLGDEAYRFVDWLAAAGQTWWQMLPLGPPGEGGSPYKSPSAFAASPELLARPDAPLSDDELAEFRSREAYWIGDWERFAGDGALAGQVWGNPLYDWPALRRRRYAWWVERLRRANELYDVCRIDHFRGFVSYWAVPAGAAAPGGRRSTPPGGGSASCR